MMRRTHLVLSFVLLAALIFPRSAFALIEPCEPTGYADFDELLSRTISTLGTYDGGVALSDSGAAMSLQLQWEDIAGQWSEIALPPNGAVVAFAAEQLAKVLEYFNAFASDFDERDWYFAQLYLALQSFEKALARFGCEQIDRLI